MLNRKELRRQKRAIEDCIDQHEKMRNSYFWRPPGSAASRRNYENKNSCSFSGNILGTKIEIECGTTCSCRNIYYKGIFYVDGKKKNITAIKNIYTALDSIV